MRNKPNQTLDWDIKAQPLKTITGIETDTRAIMRNDTNAILGYVSGAYKPLPNRELIKLCNAIERVGNYRIEGYEEFRGGKLVMAFIRNHTPGLKLNGLDLAEYLVIGNSHDKSRKLFIGTTHNLIRCENQFSSVKPIFRSPHRGHFDFQESFVKGLQQQYESHRKALYSQMTDMESTKVDSDIINRMIIYLMNNDRKVNDKKQLDEILASEKGLLLRKSITRETRDLGMTAFGLLNGVTWYTSHEIRSGRSNFGNISGIAATMNKMAYDFCTTMISPYKNEWRKEY